MGLSRIMANYSGGTSFNSSNLGGGIDLNADALVIDLTGCKTFQNSGDNVHTARMKYRVYKQGGATGAFIPINLPFFGGDGNPNKEWQEGTDINLLNGLTEAGIYEVEVFYEADGVSSGGIPFQVFEPMQGTSHVAQFTVTTALPAEFIFFNATSTMSNNALSWQTASEHNNSHFDIERSPDANTWEKIGQLSGRGNSLETNNYQFTDTRPLNGINYYRLKQC